MGVRRDVIGTIGARQLNRQEIVSSTPRSIIFGHYE